MPAAPNGAAQLGSSWLGEVLERRARPPLLALEQHRHERGGEHNGRTDQQSAHRHELPLPLTQRPVAHLIVVLEVAQQATAVEARRRSTMAAPPKTRVVARIAKALNESRGEVVEIEPKSS